MPEHEHTLEPVRIPNPDRYFLASREDIVLGHQCTACLHVESSPGWDGNQRIHRDELCERCDGPVKQIPRYEAQDMGRGPSRVISYYQCTVCGHEQYYFKKDSVESKA